VFVLALHRGDLYERARTLPRQRWHGVPSRPGFFARRQGRDGSLVRAMPSSAPATPFSTRTLGRVRRPRLLRTPTGTGSSDSGSHPVVRRVHAGGSTSPAEAGGRAIPAASYTSSRRPPCVAQNTSPPPLSTSSLLDPIVPTRRRGRPALRAPPHLCGAHPSVPRDPPPSEARSERRATRRPRQGLRAGRKLGGAPGPRSAPVSPLRRHRIRVGPPAMHRARLQL